jgi:hypothetical protein
MNAPPTDPQTSGRVPSQWQPARQPHAYDALDVTLHDDELIAETELTALLMVAVNDAADADCDGPLPQYEVDRLLGLR